MYKKNQQLQTAIEARRFMVANPGCRVKCTFGYFYRWSNGAAQFEVQTIPNNTPWGITGYPDEVTAPFAIIDEPEETERLDLQTGEVRQVSALKAAITEWKQPEWVRVKVSQQNPPIRPMDDVHISEAVALQHICQHAQQVRITWPEWVGGEVEYLPSQEGELYGELVGINTVPPVFPAMYDAKHIFFALQIGAVVEYLPKEGK